MARKAVIKEYVVDGEVTLQGNDAEPVAPDAPAAEDPIAEPVAPDAPAAEDPIDEKTMAEMRLGAAVVAQYAAAAEAE